MAPSRSADLLPKSRKIVWTLTWAALATSSRWISARKWVFKSAVVSLRIRWRVAAAEVARARMVYALLDFILIMIHTKLSFVKWSRDDQPCASKRGKRSGRGVNNKIARHCFEIGRAPV